MAEQTFTIQLTEKQLRVLSCAMETACWELTEDMDADEIVKYSKFTREIAGDVWRAGEAIDRPLREIYAERFGKRDQPQPVSFLLPL
ncbi:MAG: hypothetical protein WCF84_02180 [Anaerolineae bacterium]